MNVPPTSLAAVVLMAIVSAVSGASEPNATNQGTAPTPDFDRLLDKLKGAPDAPPPMVAGGDTTSVAGLVYSSTPEMQAELGNALYSDYTASLEHNRSLFEWQLRSSRIIFWVVLFLVFVGILFSSLQFWKGVRLSRTASAKEQQEARTELEFSTKGIKVSSSTLGVVILVIALAFLYLFLVHVYPIENVRGAPAPATSSPAGD